MILHTKYTLEKQVLTNVKWILKSNHNCGFMRPLFTDSYVPLVSSFGKFWFTSFNVTLPENLWKSNGKFFPDLIGHCTLIESELSRPLLWLACRHHIYELRIKHAAETVTENNKDPNINLFRRLKSEWLKISINYEKLCKFVWQTDDTFLKERAADVLAWALDHLEKPHSQGMTTKS